MPAAQELPPEGVRRLARAAGPDRAFFVDALVAETSRAIPTLGNDAELSGLLRASIEENVTRIMLIMGDGVEPTSDPPYSAIEYARRLVDTSTSLASLLRAYRIGQARFNEYCVTKAAQLDEPITAADQVWVLNAVSTYLDHVCEQVTGVYEREHDRWVRSQEGERRLWISRLLEDLGVDQRRAEKALGYTLSGQHLAFEVWASSPDVDLELACNAVARAYGSWALPLVVRRGQLAASAWCHPTATPDDLASVLPPGVRVALGEIGQGLDGFRTTREQAQEVRTLMLAARHQPTAATWSEVAVVAPLVADPVACRGLVERVLGALATDDARTAELRETLRTWLELNRSHAATAQAMHLHRNTVNYRVQQALELCGLEPEGHTFELLAALNADRWCP